MTHKIGRWQDDAEYVIYIRSLGPVERMQWFCATEEENQTQYKQIIERDRRRTAKQAA
jgi:hypothetical protein